MGPKGYLVPKIQSKQRTWQHHAVVSAGEQGLQCVHERHSLVGLEQTGGVDNGEFLLVGEDPWLAP